MLQILDCSSSGLSAIVSAFHKIVQLIQIIVPILLMIGATIGLYQMVTNPERKNGLKNIINKVIAAVMVFFIPMFVNLVMGLMGDTTSISSCWNDVQSGIGPATDYIDPYEGKEKSGFIDDPDDYEKGKPKKATSNLPSILDSTDFSNYQTLASCESETMKYKIIRVNNHADLAIVWVQDANSQLRLGLAAANSYQRLPAETILNNEISANGYQSKCLVAVNASFFSYSTNSPVSNVVVHNGQIVKNKGNASGCIGVNNQNQLVECSHQSAQSIVSQGIQNTFGISHKASLTSSGPTANRTQICQIDTNNFVLLSGDGTVGGTAIVIANVTGCKDTYNLDGGGSRKLYYKTQSGGVTKIFGGSRTVPDMLYFAEQ